MNAIQPSRPNLQTVKSRRMSPRTSRQHKSHRYQAIAGETTAKLVVNGVLSIAAIAALVQLLPFHLSQRAKLQEIQGEVQRTETRVSQLRSNLNRYFDPQQSRSLMQEQSHRVDPTQRQVIWVPDLHEKSKPQ